MKTLTRFTVLVLLLSFAVTARAQVPPAAANLVHPAPAEALREGEATKLLVSGFGEQAPPRVYLFIRQTGTHEYRKLEFQRGTSPTLLYATVPAELLTPPGPEYYITWAQDDQQGQVFASAEEPHRLLVQETFGELMEQELLRRHQGRRFAVEALYSFSNFGHAEDGHWGEQQGKTYPDYYHSVTTAFTYRFLRPGIYQIRCGYGMLGGVLGSRVAEDDYERDRYQSEGWDSSTKEAGLYYGFGSVYWEFHMGGLVLGLEPKLIMGASHRGFEVGFGLLTRIGMLTGTHLDLGVEAISSTGYKFITEFEWDTLPHLRMSLRNEMTDFPSAGMNGSQPTLNAKVYFDSLVVHASVGYGVRYTFEDGGVTAGGGLSFEF